MAYTPTQFAQNAENSTSETTIYTVPASTSAIVKQIVLCNTSGSSTVYSISLVPSGGSAGAGNRIAEELALAANSTTLLDMSQVMAAGDFISILQGTAGAVTVTISGVEIT